MKKNKKFTVTIGIPAHNEEANIVYLLDSVLKQKGKLFTIKKIIVICDGCTDQTADKVRLVAKEHSVIELFNGTKRLGQAQRLNQLYTLNTSDIIITLDADIVLDGTNFIEKIVRPFKVPKTILVSGNNQPVKAETFTERVYNAGYKMWYEIRKDYRNGNNVNNLHGCAVALKDSFAKSVKSPKKTAISQAGFVFMMARIHKGRFCFVKNALVLFRSVNNLGDFFLQAKRNLRGKNTVANYFGDWVYKEYSISRKCKLKGIIKTLYLDPIFTALAIILKISLRILPAKQVELENDGKWQIAESTKRAITEVLHFL